MRLQVEQSQLRQKINERLGEDELTDEQRAELDQWTTRAQEVEVEHYGRGRERDPSLVITSAITAPARNSYKSFQDIELRPCSA